MDHSKHVTRGPNRLCDNDCGTRADFAILRQLERAGWYIWCGETFSEAADFFASECARHLYDDAPEAGRLLGLPPGYRFFLAGDRLDVWFDEKSLEV